MEYFSWGSPTQCLPWSRVECERYSIQVGDGHVAEIGPLRKVLPQQAIGILVGATLPRTVWIAEEERAQFYCGVDTCPYLTQSGPILSRREAGRSYICCCLVTIGASPRLPTKQGTAAEIVGLDLPDTCCCPHYLKTDHK